MSTDIQKSAQDPLGRFLARWRNRRVAQEIVAPFLDIACGDNFLARQLLDGGTGVDVVDHGDADVIVEDFSNLPFDAQQFRSVSIVASLNYFDDPASVLAECKRVLHRDGQIIITILNPVIGRIWHQVREPWAKRPGLSEGQLTGLAEDAGLVIRKKARFMFGMNNFYTLGRLPRPILLVSTGRTGTKFFSQFFRDYGEGVSAHHTTSYTRLINILCNMHRRKLLSTATMSKLWSFFKHSSIQTCSERYVECNPYYYNIIDIILDRFPETKIVFVVRSPKSFVLSHIKWERGRWKSALANKLIPFWQPVSYFEQLRGLAGTFHQRVEFYSQIWAKKNSDIMKSIAGKEKAVMLKFEEVFYAGSGKEILKETMDWLDVPIKKEFVETLLSDRVNASNFIPNEWDNQCTEIVRNNCGELMREFGYQE